MDKNYCGYISIIGKPNVGKSSILNTILDKKVSITSRKSQTTRNNILGIKTIKNKQMIFIDTPGMHIKSKKTMNKILNKSAESIIEDSDIIILVLQRLKIDMLDRQIIEKIKNFDKKIICVINKIDQIYNKNKLMVSRHCDKRSKLNSLTNDLRKRKSLCGINQSEGGRCS